MILARSRPSSALSSHLRRRPAAPAGRVRALRLPRRLPHRPSRPRRCPTAQPDPLPSGETRAVTISTDLGTITLTSRPICRDRGRQLRQLAECGFYDGVVFHRVVPGFVIQGGDPTGTGTGGPGYNIKDEAVTTPYARGTVAMARTPAPDSVGSQFFIVLDDEARGALESANTYQIIGSVTAGMETADAIAAAADAELPAIPDHDRRDRVGRPPPRESTPMTRATSRPTSRHRSRLTTVGAEATRTHRPSPTSLLRRGLFHRVTPFRLQVATGQFAKVGSSATGGTAVPATIRDEPVRATVQLGSLQWPIRTTPGSPFFSAPTT